MIFSKSAVGNTHDNYLVQLIRHTIEFIKTKPFGNHLLNKVNDEVFSIINSTSTYKYEKRSSILMENVKRPIRHAYFHEYRMLQKLCIMILRYEKQQIDSNKFSELHGILFDGSWLWEEYINTLVKEDFYHPMNKENKGFQYLFDRKRGRIYPDFLSKKTTNRIIADAKYKPIENIKNNDYLQILAYMFRFNSHNGLYIYPEESLNDNTDIELKLNTGTSFENNVATNNNISVIKCGLKIPQNYQTYNEFTQKIKSNEKNFLKKIKNILV